MTSPSISENAGWEGKPRRTVRIKKKHSPSYSATLSLLFAVAAALWVILVWSLWQEDTSSPVPYRTLSDILMNWRCESGHDFEMPGQVGEKACLICGKPAFPTTTFVCEDHGPFLVQARFSDESGSEHRVTHYRLLDQPWMPAEKKLRCPRCQKILFENQLDPLASIGE